MLNRMKKKYLILMIMYTLTYLGFSHANQTNSDFSKLGYSNEIKNRFFAYRAAYDDLQKSNNELFELFFSESIKRRYIDVDFTERFPTLGLTKLLKMPAEIDKIEDLSILSCRQFNQSYCLKIVGYNENNVEVEVTLHYVFERNDWFINFIDFKV